MKRWLRSTTCILVGLTLTFAPSPTTAGPPASRPTTKPASADDTADWLLNQSALAITSKARDAPATQPATAQTREQREQQRKAAGYRKGVIVTSDGEKLKGDIATTAEKPVRVWDEEKKQYRDIPFARHQNP